MTYPNNLPLPPFHKEKCKYHQMSDPEIITLSVCSGLIGMDSNGTAPTETGLFLSDTGQPLCCD